MSVAGEAGGATGSSAWVPGSVAVGNQVVSLTSREQGRVLLVEARLPVPPGTAAVPGLLADLELSAPGDTRLVVDAAGLLVTRTVPDPDATRVREVVESLAALAATAAAGQGTLAEAEAARRGLDAAPPEPMTLSSGERDYLARFRMPPAPQPAWVHPDPASAPDRELHAGQWYEVLQEANGWAQVLGDDGVPVWTDGRTLLATEGQP